MTSIYAQVLETGAKHRYLIGEGRQATTPPPDRVHVTAVTKVYYCATLDTAAGELLGVGYVPPRPFAHFIGP